MTKILTSSDTVQYRDAVENFRIENALARFINFARDALYMMGAFVAYFILAYAGLSYWWVIQPAARWKGPRRAG